MIRLRQYKVEAYSLNNEPWCLRSGHDDTKCGCDCRPKYGDEFANTRQQREDRGIFDAHQREVYEYDKGSNTADRELCTDIYAQPAQYAVE